MNDVLKAFSKEVLVEYIAQNLGLRNLKHRLERDLLYIAWDQQTKTAQKMMDAACKLYESAEKNEEWMAARKDFESAMAASKKADRLYGKLDKLAKL